MTTRTAAFAVIALLGLIAAITAPALARPFDDPRSARIAAIDADAGFAKEARDPACHAPVLASTGGALPKGPSTLAIRWTGFSNFELSYKGQIVLLDAYFDRGSNFPSLGFKAADVSRANVILIGHGHHDHMSDAASVGIRTGATMVGAPLTTEKLLSQKVDPQKIRTVTGREPMTLDFGAFKVEPILGRHGEPPKQLVDAFGGALRASTPKLTEAQLNEFAEIRSRGVQNPRVVDEGTIAYLITLDNGFRIMYRDSGGRVTEFEKTAMERIGRVDVALVAVSASFLHTVTAAAALEHVRTYRPDVYIPAHHDAALNGLWRATEPLFQAVKDDNPNIVTMSKSYREPTCFNTDHNISRAR
jgi:L-ascorbate metabolism protein UlaG (beta-lactamase superfamily)